MKVFEENVRDGKTDSELLMLENTYDLPVEGNRLDE